MWVCLKFNSWPVAPGFYFLIMQEICDDLNNHSLHLHSVYYVPATFLTLYEINSIDPHSNPEVEIIISPFYR